MKSWKWIWTQLHWLLGITAGTVMAIMGLTGATLSFEDEILRLLNPGVVTVADTPAPALDPMQLLEAAKAAEPERRVSSLMLEADAESSVRVTYAKPGSRQGDARYLHPETGAMLGEERGHDTLHFFEDIHRGLAAGDTGKAVTGACALILIGMLLTGLYLRWPAIQPGNWRRWLTLNTKFRRRAFLLDLHQVVGTWLLIPLLLSTLTGLYWSYDWYKNGLYRLAGVPIPVQQPRAPQGQNSGQGAQKKGGREDAAPSVPMNLDLVWQQFQAQVPGGYERVTLRFPEKAGQPVQFLYLDTDPAHNRAFSRMEVDALSGEVQKHEPYADKARGAQFLTTMFPLHTGSYFGLPGRLVMMMSSLMLPLFFVTGWMMYLHRRRMQREQKARMAAQQQGSSMLA